MHPVLDTSADAERAQIELLRRASPARHVRLTRSLSQTVVNLSRRAIRRARPELTEQQVLLEFLAVAYGEELAAKVRRHLASRNGVDPA